MTAKVQHFYDNLVISIIIDYRWTKHILLPWQNYYFNSSKKYLFGYL